MLFAHEPGCDVRLPMIKASKPLWNQSATALSVVHDNTSVLPSSLSKPCHTSTILGSSSKATYSLTSSVNADVALFQVALQN